MRAPAARVVRLKGGDPFVFGRGGEEREYLLRHGMRVEVVPGITAAIGCAAAAGIPLTHRDQAQTLTIVTAHGQRRRAGARLARRSPATGRRSPSTWAPRPPARVAARLIEHGRDPATPAAVIVNGTLRRAADRRGPARATSTAWSREAGSGPALILIGEVVRHADAWIDAARGRRRRRGELNAGGSDHERDQRQRRGRPRRRAVISAGARRPRRRAEGGHRQPARRRRRRLPRRRWRWAERDRRRARRRRQGRRRRRCWRTPSGTSALLPGRRRPT